MDTKFIVYEGNRVVYTCILEKKYRKNLKAGLKKFISQYDPDNIKESMIPSRYLEEFPPEEARMKYFEANFLPKINICIYILNSLKKDKSKLELNISHLRQIKNTIDTHCDYPVYKKFVRDVFYL